MVIEVRDLAKRVDSGGQPLTILHEISFAVAAGETVDAVGARRASKSMRMPPPIRIAPIS